MPLTADLAGQVALVTGASRNIGRAIAETLAANGATVVFTDMRAADAEAAAKESPRAIGLELDVRDESAVERVIADVEGRFGRLDVLVNNAGINTTKRVTIDEFPREEWDKI